MENHQEIRSNLISASYKAIEHLQGILSEPILKVDGDDELGPEKFLSALKAKKQAQTDAFEMLIRIEDEQRLIDAENKAVSNKQDAINKSNSGFAENNAK